MQRYNQSGDRATAFREPQRDWQASRHEPRPERTDRRPDMARPARSNDPIEMADAMLSNPQQRKALLEAVEANVKRNQDERRHFAAAVGRVYKLTGEMALTQAVRNYLSDLTHPSENDRSATLEWLTKTVSTISGIPLFGIGTPGSAAANREREAEATPLDPRAAAEALFRPRP